MQTQMQSVHIYLYSIIYTILDAILATFLHAVVGERVFMLLFSGYECICWPPHGIKDKRSARPTVFIIRRIHYAGGTAAVCVCAVILLQQPHTMRYTENVRA